jgi:N-methylhydantoinase A
MIALGVDVGGTNTDIVLSGVDGDAVVVHKLPTSSDDPSSATVQGTLEICAMAGIAPGEIELVLHGTTVATNALLEHDGARTGLITTEGFRDILHIGRHQRPHNFSLMQDIPFQRWPLVERRHRRPVPERIVPPGEVAVPLDEEATVRAIHELRDDGVESIAVCFLFSFLNPEHEIRAGELVAEHHPDAEISLSHRVIAQFREFERFTTTAANAFIKPRVRGYLSRLERGWREVGVTCPIHIMQSNGGVAAVDQAADRAVNVLLSGPAAGVIAGQHVGRQSGHDHLITLDIGGTSADISVIPGRLLELNMQDSYMGGYPILSPKLDVTAIGAGGGSVAWVDAGGAFNVGPRSAGAEPGPACYGRGGTEPTVTDAHLVLGRVDPASFLGGRMELHPDLAREAISRVGEAFGMDADQAALAILRIVNANMVREIRVHSIRRGYDPRECALVAFGGAGPLHACAIAEELEIPAILVPPSPGITSAMGLLATDLRYDSVRTVGMMLETAEREALEQRFAEMTEELHARFEGHVGPEPAVRREAMCRYAGQGYELSASCDDLGEDWRERIEGNFHRQHEHEYGFHFPNDPVEIISLRTTAVSEIPARPVVARDDGDGRAGAPRAVGRADVVFARAGEPERRSVPTYDRDALPIGSRLDGPCMVLEMDSTIVVGPSWGGEVLADGTLRLTREEQA